MTATLEVLEPSGSSVSYRGETVEVRPLTIGQLPKLVRTARPVINAVLSLQSLPDDTETTAFVDLIVDMLADHGESIYQAAAICIGKPVDWVADGELDEFVQLAKAVIEVNRDFFVQRLGPLLANRANNPATGGGLTRSSS